VEPDNRVSRSDAARAENDIHNDDETETKPSELKPHGRYHDESYIREAATAGGLTMLRLVHETLRIERGRSVAGTVISASHSGT